MAILKRSGSFIASLSSAGYFWLQKVLIDQIEDIHSQLPTLNWVGVGRDEGKDAGEYIFVSTTIEVKKYAVHTDSKDLRYQSDHLPVFANIGLKAGK